MKVGQFKEVDPEEKKRKEEERERREQEEKEQALKIPVGGR